MTHRHIFVAKFSRLEPDMIFDHQIINYERATTIKAKQLG